MELDSGSAGDTRWADGDAHANGMRIAVFGAEDSTFTLTATLTVRRCDALSDCSGHGACRSAAEGGGCACHAGQWEGEHCATPVCPRAAARGPSVAASKGGLAGLISRAVAPACSGHGTCDAGSPDTDRPRCACDAGFAGAACEHELAAPREQKRPAGAGRAGSRWKRAGNAVLAAKRLAWPPSATVVAELRSSVVLVLPVSPRGRARSWSWSWCWRSWCWHWR